MIDETKFIDRLGSDNCFGGLDDLSYADPVPDSKGLIRGPMYKVQQMGLWKQNPGLDEQEHEGDAWDSQSHCSSGRRRRPLFNPVTDINSWVISEPWMRLVMPDLEHSNTEMDYFSQEDAESEKASFLTRNVLEELYDSPGSLEPESATGCMIWDNEQSTLRPPMEPAVEIDWVAGDDILWPWLKTIPSSDKETSNELYICNLYTDEEEAATKWVSTDH